MSFAGFSYRRNIFFTIVFKDSLLRNCTDCLGFFHDNCHLDITTSKKTRAASCPSCVRIYANAVKDKSQKFETYKKNKTDTEIENEGDDENSEGIEEVDFLMQEHKINKN